ncbi:MAG: cysteine desulfurase family protein, partial [Peptococcaceae bacterium]|nr:cysteine desulfurase family protein [Peptococcaceae bacterium]
MLYLDYAATTPVRPEVQQEMANYFAAQFANPHSPHDAGLAAKAEVEGARRRIATVLGIWPRQIVFTSGGTEANNLAVFGLARAARKNGKRVLTTAIEHKSVLSPIEALTREGFNADLLPVDSYGTVDLAGIDNKLTADTLLIALAHANNEIGTIQPISKIAGLIRDKSRGKKIYLHCDAVQSFGKIPVQFAALGVDTLTISGHKIYGPKGIGVLIIAPGVRLEPLMFGGDQERGLRPGTLNVPAVMGLAKAVELAAAELDRESSRQNVLCKLALRELLQL